MRFIHAADLHLDSPLRGLEEYPGAPVERLRGATREAIVEAAKAFRADLIMAEGFKHGLIGIE